MKKNPSEESSVSSEPDSNFLNATAWVPASLGDVDGYPNETVDAASAGMIPPELVEQGLSGTFHVLFSTIAQARGDHWLLKDFEVKGLAASWTPLLQLFLQRLGSTEQGMLAVALLTTVPIVAGKLAQDVTKRASSMASTRTAAFAASSASSESVEAVKQQELSNSSQPAFD